MTSIQHTISMHVEILNKVSKYSIGNIHTFQICHVSNGINPRAENKSCNASHDNIRQMYMNIHTRHPWVINSVELHVWPFSCIVPGQHSLTYLSSPRKFSEMALSVLGPTGSEEVEELRSPADWRCSQVERSSEAPMGGGGGGGGIWCCLCNAWGRRHYFPTLKRK